MQEAARSVVVEILTPKFFRCIPARVASTKAICGAKINTEAINIEHFEQFTEPSE
jgi:hypothetical protein